MKFLDQAKIFINAGSGGDGVISFRHEKFLEFGGPDGGNGGKGGDVWIEIANGLNTLVDYRYQKYFNAKAGRHGMGKNRNGAKGTDVVLKVPAGTQIFEEDKTTFICDLTKVGQRFCLARGGNGGFGNFHFTSSTNRSPHYANPGKEGEQRVVWLSLKLIADVGLIGLPNAGKSTFLSSVTSAKPKIANYPFTTLYPNLGVVTVGEREFILADIPGLIEGAHAGSGLGCHFLRHVERTNVLLHLVSACETNIENAYHVIRQELKAYGNGLVNKTEILALCQCDILSRQEQNKKRTILEKTSKKQVITLSSVNHHGLKEVLHALLQKVLLSEY